jgi:replicative DNA helicase
MLDKTVLAYALKDKKFTMELTNSVTFEYFKTDFQPIFKAVREHFTDARFKEIPTENVFREYIDTNYAEPEFRTKMMGLYTEIKSSETNEAEFSWHLEKLKARYNDQLQRTCASKMVQFLKSEPDPIKRVEEINQIVKETVVNIDAIYKQEAYKEGSLDESAKERFEKYKEIEANPELAKGILTGFAEFDRITAGLHPGEVMIVAGATGTGKSVVMHNIGVNAYLNGNNPLLAAEHAVKKGYNILYFSLEMPKETIERHGS